MKKITSKRIAFFGVLGAFIFVSLSVESYVLAKLFAGFNPAMLSIPITISLCVFSGDKRNILFGGILGISSMIIGLTLGIYVWLNPLISILPRILMGLVAYLISKTFLKLNSNKKDFFSKVLPYSLGGIFGCIANTVFVLGFLWVFGQSTFEGVISTITSINTPFEIVFSAILTPIFVNVERKIYFGEGQ